VGQGVEVGAQEQDLLPRRLAAPGCDPARGHALGSDHAEDVDKIDFAGASANTNCALRALRRMLHKAEEWKLVRSAAKIKLL
jgi:hypothetical protein